MTIAELIFYQYPTQRFINAKELINTVTQFAHRQHKLIVKSYKRRAGFVFTDGSTLRIDKRFFTLAVGTAQ